jgi:hypothetical protein
MRLYLRTDRRGRLVATLSSRAGTRILVTTAGALFGGLGAGFVFGSVALPSGALPTLLGIIGALCGLAFVYHVNRVDRWVFDAACGRVERHRIPLVPLEPRSWPLDQILEVAVNQDPDENGDVFPNLVLRFRSGQILPLFDGYVPPGSVQPAGEAAHRINEFLGEWR